MSDRLGRNILMIVALLAFTLADTASGTSEEDTAEEDLVEEDVEVDFPEDVLVEEDIVEEDIAEEDLDATAALTSTTSTPTTTTTTIELLPFFDDPDAAGDREGVLTAGDFQQFFRVEFSDVSDVEFPNALLEDIHDVIPAFGDLPTVRVDLFQSPTANPPTDAGPPPQHTTGFGFAYQPGSLLIVTITPGVDETGSAESATQGTVEGYVLDATCDDEECLVVVLEGVSAGGAAEAPFVILLVDDLIEGAGITVSGTEEEKAGIIGSIYQDESYAWAYPVTGSVGLPESQ